MPRRCIDPSATGSSLGRCRGHADPSRASNAEWREGETSVAPIRSPEAIGRSGKTLRDVGLEYLREGSETERLRSIGLLLGPNVHELLRRCEEHVALASGNYLRLLPQCFRHPRQALLALLDKSTAQRHVAGSQCD